MQLSMVQLDTIRSALSSREAEIKRLLENSFLDEIDLGWKPRLRAELAQIPRLKNMMLDAMYPNNSPISGG